MLFGSSVLQGDIWISFTGGYMDQFYRGIYGSVELFEYLSQGRIQEFVQGSYIFFFQRWLSIRFILKSPGNHRLVWSSEGEGLSPSLSCVAYSSLISLEFYVCSNFMSLCCSVTFTNWFYKPYKAGSIVNSLTLIKIVNFVTSTLW